MTAIDSALNPNTGHPTSRERPLSNTEQMQRNKALCAANGKSDSLSCSGNLFVGMFFDGTGNNEQKDYKDIIDLSKRCHSNVVRLLHIYPDNKEVGTNRYYRYYIPGVGTPFPEIGDTGSYSQKFGGIGAWDGEPRIIWGLTEIFNAVHRYHYQRPLIEPAQAGKIANGTGGVGSLSGHRHMVFKDYWQDKLKSAIKGRKPEIDLINLSVFGFSRGAAEARTFVNWLYEICEQKDGGWTFAGIPLRIQFLGLFDTVASVGAAGLYSILEGHQSWASNTMQIHPAVEQCLHFVAGHEVRACFPSDSVRIEGSYPANAKEYVYPGAHSDVGGGYKHDSQGKIDRFARIPGYDMYCAALAAGVPFNTLKQLDEMKQQPVVDALIPHPEDITLYQSYCREAAITPGPVEDMSRQHMSWYFSYRWQLGTSGYSKRPFFQPAQKADPRMPAFLSGTQQSIIDLLSELGDRINRQIKLSTTGDSQGKLKWFALNYSQSNVTGIDAKAANIRNDIARWRKWLTDQNMAEVHDASAPEREPAFVVDALKAEKISLDMTHFFDLCVHDSVAGFACDNSLNEYETNGIGIVKFRRIFFGNKGDSMIHRAVEKGNERRIADAEKNRKELEQAHREAEEFRRTRS